MSAPKLKGRGVFVLTLLTVSGCMSACMSAERALPTSEHVERAAHGAQASVSATVRHHTSPLKSYPDSLSHKASPLVITELNLKSKLLGAQGVRKWEPSGVAVLGERLWVVSDKEGWLASYDLPLKEGALTPRATHQLTPPLDNRVKWEGLEAHPKGGLVLLEAISRTVWWCHDPEGGCPQLTSLPMKALNPALNQAAPLPFRYLMFEALLVTPHGVWVGTRGLNALPSGDSKGGLTPWSVWGQVTGEGAPRVVRPHDDAWRFEGRLYGLSGASYDPRGGAWLTLSYEDEDAEGSSAVSGLLVYAPLPLTPTQLSGPAPSAQVCARFSLKPEGVTLDAKGHPIVVFDQDSDRKGGRTKRPQRFALELNEDYVWHAPAQLLSCAKPAPSPHEGQVKEGQVNEGQPHAP